MTKNKGYYCEVCKAFHGSRNTVKAHKKANADAKKKETDGSVTSQTADAKAVTDQSLNASVVTKIDLKKEYDDMTEEINPKPEKTESPKNETGHCNGCGKSFKYDPADPPTHCPKCGVEFA